MKALLFIIALTTSVGAFSQAFSPKYIDSLERRFSLQRDTMNGIDAYIVKLRDRNTNDDSLPLLQKAVMRRMIENSTILRKYYILSGKTTAQEDVERMQVKLRVLNKAYIFKPLEL